MKNNIPKKIHYCWFGGKPLPEEAKKCISSWEKYCPDYEIIEWNENNFDLKSNTYIKEAYSAKKWAFVTDYVRLFVLYNYGGVYMDTDVELVKPIDAFLRHRAFSGFESSGLIPTGIMASEKKFELFKEFLDYYDNRHFILGNNINDMTTNVEIMTNICKRHGLLLNNKLQNVDGFVLYPSDVFCPKDFATGKIKQTVNTVAIHHFAGSWLDDGQLKLKKLRNGLCQRYGDKIGNFMYKYVCIPYRLYIHIISYIIRRVRKDSKE